MMNAKSKYIYIYIYWIDKKSKKKRNKGRCGGGNEIRERPKSQKNLFFLSFLLYLIRWIQLPESGFAIQTRVLILFDSNLYALLYVGNCIVGLILARSRCCTSACIIRCHDASNNGNSDVRYQRIIASSLIHKGYWCVDGRVSDVCLRSATRVCACQLRVTLRFVWQNQLTFFPYFLSSPLSSYHIFSTDIKITVNNLFPSFSLNIHTQIVYSLSVTAFIINREIT